MKKRSLSPSQQADLDEQLRILKTSVERNKGALSLSEIKILERITVARDLPGAFEPLYETKKDKRTN